MPASKACPVSRSRAVIHTGSSTPGQPRNVKVASTAAGTTFNAIGEGAESDTYHNPVTRSPL